MSYILDALKRAESDRGRGSVPGLHTQQVMAGGAGADGGAARPAWFWPLVGGSLLFAAGVGLYVFKPLSVRVNTGAVLPPPPAAANTAALPPPQITAMTAVPTSPSTGEPDVTAPRASRRAATATAAAAANNGPAPTSEPRVYAINDLPPDIRSTLPKLTIGGSSYSTNPALRMLMINGRMYQEKDQAGPDLVLEQIRQGSAVMRFKGYRYRITY